MLPKTYRNIACLLALSLGVALGGTEAEAASASGLPGSSDPTALALLHQAEGMYTPSAPTVTGRMAIPAEPNSGTSTRVHGVDGTSLMVELAGAMPRLNAADRATAMRVLSTPASATSPCALGQETGSASDPSHFVTDTTAHFAVTYTVTAGDNDAVTQGYANHVEDVLEHVYDTEIAHMGFNPPLSPLTSSPLTDPTPRTPIALCNIQSGLYGFCSPIPVLAGNGQPAACVLRNDYAGYLIPEDNGNIDAPLSVTAAHEFFHAVQFRQNAFINTTTPPLWLMEGTAVWMESQVYPDIHDYLQYLPATGIQNPSVPFNVTVTSADFFPPNDPPLWPFTVYADFAFFKFLSGWLKDPGTVKQIWDYLGPTHPSASPMAALKAVLKTHRRNITQMLLNWSIWNTLPPGSYPERGFFGPVHWWQVRKLDRTKRTYTLSWTDSAHRKRTTLPIRPFADAPIKINRGSAVRPGTKLRVVISGPSYKAGGYYTYRVSRANGTQLTVTRQVGPHGSAFIIPFNRSVSFVAFTLNNTNPNRTQAFRISASVL